MNPQIANLVLLFFVVQVARKFNLEDPDVLFYVRAAYATSQLFVLSLCYITNFKVKSKNDNTPLKYVEPPKPFQQEPNKVVQTTYRDYDLEKVDELIKQTLMGVVIMSALHFYWNFTQPLFIQTILPVKNVLQNNVIRIHLLGHKAEGELKRPFKNVSPFGALAEAQQPATDKASIKKAEKAAKKDE
ncbi:1583_t:CDS:2 [Ambispora gerdemannii]|uniref:1583_t:CDS:1 n=1 Tax=Ambispora gerdemannii TaxID=144530 RepID=A0A9N8V2M7_9GLOM|nr:1583_t:CDS:2 [Ambispora gerdemannii]